MIFTKGHGTENDFVLLPDLDAQLDLAPAAVAALCDRRQGLGADGVLRVTTAGAVVAAGVLDRLPEGVDAGDWYMDYRNADGSIAQMCGNGVRVFAHYLRASGLEQRDEFVVGSLAGPRPVVVHHADALDAEVTVDMGKVNRLGTGTATVGGRHFTGVGVDVGNPHLACLDPGLTEAALAALDVGRARAVRPRPVPRRRQRRGADHRRRRRGQHAGARTRCRRDPLLRHRDGGRRGRRAGAPQHVDRHAAGAHPRRGGHRRGQPTPAAPCADRRCLVAHGEVADTWWAAH